MSIASSSSSSSSALRQAMQQPRASLASMSRRMTAAETGGSKPIYAARPYAAAAYQRPVEAPEPPISDTPAAATGASASQSGRPSSSKPSYPIPNVTSPLTASGAQAYLSDLLDLPSSRAFPPDLALQILTHKSFRYAHLIRHPPRSRSDRSTPSPSPRSDGSETDLDGPSSVSHNSRLSFLGRRALATYLGLFLHSHLRSDRGLRQVDFVRGRGLDEKIKAMLHVNNLGREVGARWSVGDVMRWDRNETGVPGANQKIKGLTVESILGGVFSEFGSAAAHRAFHLHVLPHLEDQLRDPMLQERAEGMRREVEREFGRSILSP